jgi:hypothetical protein
VPEIYKLYPFLLAPLFGLSTIIFHVSVLCLRNFKKKINSPSFLTPYFVLLLYKSTLLPPHMPRRTASNTLFVFDQFGQFGRFGHFGQIGLFVHFGQFKYFSPFGHS